MPAATLPRILRSRGETRSANSGAVDDKVKRNDMDEMNDATDSQIKTPYFKKSSEILQTRPQKSKRTRPQTRDYDHEQDMMECARDQEEHIALVKSSLYVEDQSICLGQPLL